MKLFTPTLLIVSLVTISLNSIEGFQRIKYNPIIQSTGPSTIIVRGTLMSPDSVYGKIDLLYDSECPICQMEVDFLKKRDINNRIRYTDLSSPNYNPAEHGNVKFEDGMRKIRAVLPDNTVVTGVEVFRQTYEVIGLGWVFALTSFPIIGEIADLIYDLWAENRLRITGRGEMADMLRKRAEELRLMETPTCDAYGCGIDYEI